MVIEETLGQRVHHGPGEGGRNGVSIQVPGNRLGNRVPGNRAKLAAGYNNIWEEHC